MRQTAILLLISLISITCANAREVININRSWQFTPSWEVKKGISTEVNLPHTWNLDALSGKADYVRTLNNYVKYIEVPKTWKDKKIFIRFMGSNQTTSLYVNGKNVGTHKGGYTAFTWDITSFVRLGERNTLWVRVTNALDLDIMPLVGDFNMYGGIYRDVDLIITPKTHIDLENFGSDGIFITPSNVSRAQADVKIATTIIGEINSEPRVTFLITDAQGERVDSLTKSVKISNNGKAETQAEFVINDPTLWNGRQNPYLYTATVKVHSAGKNTPKTTDTLSQNFGLRTFSITKDNQFILNEEPLKIHGVAKHQDWAGLGNALNKLNFDKDMELMLDMGVNAVRLAHYPHNKYFLDLCDKNGVIVWSEIPFVGPGGYRDKGFNDSQDFRDNGKQQLTEMIRQQYNHPSVLFWGLFNELVQNGDDPVPYLRELNELAKDEDPNRITVAASNQDGDLNFITDIIAFNKYMGWYGGQPQDVDGWGAGLRRDWPKLMVGISEYGAGGSIYHQSDSLTKTVPTSYFHPEQWQTYFHEQHWKTISQKPYFWGTFVWAMFDFGAAHRTEGQVPGINDKGLVTFDRTTCKDAYYFYKAVWNKKDPFVYIADRRLTTRTKATQTIKVYSNQPKVEISIEGYSLLPKEADGTGIFIWEGIQLPIGEYTVTATADKGKPDRATFSVAIPQIVTSPKE